MQQTLTVCSYNIHKGFSTSNRRFLLNEMREAIRAIDADCVFLQEIMGADKRKKTGSYDNQFEYLADSIWPHYAYGRNAVYDKNLGHYGNAMLSKHSFVLFENYNVSQWDFSRRGVLLGQLSLGVYLVCVHFGLLQSERKAQLDQLEQIIKRFVPEDVPLIIAGDFNDWTGRLDGQIKKQLQVQEAHRECYGRLAKTFPGKWPLLPVDRIYFRHLQLTEAKILKGQPWNKLSDHCPLYATFELGG